MSLLSLSKRVLGREEKPKSKNKKTTASNKKAFASVGAGKDVPAKGKGKAKTSKSENITVSIMAAKIGLTPIITERSVMQQQHNVVVFRVRPEATKHQISLAVKEKFNVNPVSVRTASYRPKTRRRGQTYGKTTFWKKAYVQVDDIQKLTTTP